jgi:arsenate reductase
MFEGSDYLVTMGCSTTKFNPERHGVRSQEWDLANPDGGGIETVREVRDEIDAKVTAPFDEVERLAEEERADADSSRGVVTVIRDTLSL